MSLKYVLPLLAILAVVFLFNSSAFDRKEVVEVKAPNVRADPSPNSFATS